MAALLLVPLACTGVIESTSDPDQRQAPGATAAGSPGTGSPGAGSPGAGSPGARSPSAGKPGTGSPGAAPPAGAPPTAASCKPGPSPRPGPSPLRRLNRYEYNNTVRDLLGVAARPADGFTGDGEAFGFDNIADLQRVTRLQAEQYQSAAVELASAATQGLTRLLPCDPLKAGEDACAADFVKVFGKRAYRRPTTTAEAARLLEVYKAGRTGADFKAGIELVIQTMLQAPAFLYRFELDAPPGAAVAAVGPWAMAARLSYLLWGTMPDDELFRAAEAGQLATKEQIAAQARRMLMDPRARAVVAEYHRQWLRLDEMATLEKDTKAYPAFSPDLPGLWRQEAELFADAVAWQGGGGLEALLGGGFSFVNAKLAGFYGVPAPAGTAFQRVTLDPAQRGAGFLTQAGTMALLGQPNQGSPVRRGVFVREHLLCQNLPPPPANVDIKPPAPSPNATTRERFAQHALDPSCNGCHRLIDPIGLGFENYDGIGKWRTTENGKPIDTSGELGRADVEGPFVGAAELGRKLATSREARSCHALSWLRFALGRGESPDDSCTLDAIERSLAAPGGNVKEMLVAVTQSDTFRFRTVNAQEGTP